MYYDPNGFWGRVQNFLYNTLFAFVILYWVYASNGTIQREGEKYPIPINRPISLQSKATHNNSARESRQDILIQALLWFASPPTNDLV